MAKSKMIDLGMDYSKMGVEATASKTPKVSYPSVHLEDVYELDNLPDGEFTFTAVGKVIRHTETTGPDNKRHCSCDIELHSIEPKGKSKPVDLAESLDEALNDKEEYDEDE